jgi:hypothetical protein
LETKPRAADRVDRWFVLGLARLQKPVKLNARWQQFQLNI